MEENEGTLMVRVCRACRAAGSQKPNGSFLCVKCDPSVSYQELIALVRSGQVSDDLYLKPGDGHRPVAVPQT